MKFLQRTFTAAMAAALIWGAAADAATFSETLASGQRMLRSKDYAGAKDAASAAAREAGTPTEKHAAAILMGQSLLQLKDIAGARAEFERVVRDGEAGNREICDARMGLADVLSAESKWAEARAQLEEVFLLQVPYQWKNNALRQYMRIFRNAGDMAGARAYVDRLLAVSSEEWTGIKVMAVNELAGMVLAIWDYEGARSIYTRIAQLPEATIENRAEALLNISRTYSREKKHASRPQALLQILDMQGISDRMMVSALSELADACYASGDAAGMEKAVDRLLTMEGQAVAGADRLLKLGELASGKADYVRASAALNRAMALPVDSLRRQKAAMALAGVEMQRGKTIAARKVLEDCAVMDGLTDANVLAARLHAAGTYAVGKDLSLVRKKIDEALKSAAALPIAERLDALYKAGAFFMPGRADATVRCYLDAAAALGEMPVKVYDCRFVSAAPIGAGGWANSAFVREKANRETRFHPYGTKDADLLMLQADATVERVQQGTQTGKAGDTFFAMLYDIKGWHIYVQSDEPNIEKIMTEGGKGGSSLEMFFSPGLEREAYYQWITRLATGVTDLINWNTPHRGFRPLEEKQDNFLIETALLPSGWGTHIFIPWEVLYDKLPFDAQNAWGFSTIRWSPAGSVTWGGRVHETGRWGEVRFQRPTDEQRLQILRHIVRRAWWKYTDVRDIQLDYWRGARGDADFCKGTLEPVIAAENEYAARLQELDSLDLPAVEKIYREKVPVWMEFGFRIAELRSAYLTDKLLSDR